MHRVSRKYLKNKWPGDHRMHELIDYINQVAPKIFMPGGLISGGLVTWLSGLTFSVTAAIYYLQDSYCETGNTTVASDAADATHPRIDVIALTSNWEVVVIKGTPAAGPLKPTIDPATQIELTFVTIPAAATGPENITDEIIYDENTEWTGSASGVTVDFDNATAPYSGAKCASVGGIGNNDTITFTAAAPKTVADYGTLGMFVKLKAAAVATHTLFAQFRLAGVAVSNEAPLPFDILNATAWQNLAIKLSGFTFTATTFDAVRLRWSKTGKQGDFTGFYLDYAKLQKGVPQAAADGREVELATADGYVVWRYRGDIDWINLFPIPPDGVDGISAGRNFYPDPLDAADDVDISVVDTYTALALPSLNIETTIEKTLSTNDPVLIGKFLTNPGSPDVDEFPAGVVLRRFYASTALANQYVRFKVETYRCASNGIIIELMNTDYSQPLSDVLQEVRWSAIIQQSRILDVTDRILYKIYAERTVPQTCVVTMYFCGTQNTSFIQSTISVGRHGLDAFVYIAYASDNAGTGFTLTFDAGLDYIAILSTNTEITTPVVGDFAGLWKNYKGAPGADAELPLQVTALTLASGSWSLVTGLYEYDLANANITATAIVDVIPDNADIAIVKAAEILPKTVSSAGSVKLYATNAPTGDIGVTINIFEATT